jgi:uncharacterized protein (TIGR00369 family)
MKNEEEWKKLSDEERIEKFCRFFHHINHFDRHLGLQLVLPTPSTKPHYEMTVEDHHLSSPGVAHGGTLSAMMDAVLGLEALLESVRVHSLCSTVEFKMNFMTPALLGDHLIGEATVDFKGNSLIIVSGGLYHKKQRHLICKGMGTFNVYPMNKKVDLYESLFKTLHNLNK